VLFRSLIVQNALPQKIGQATSAMVFFRQIGGTIGLAAMGSLMTSAYLPAFHNALPAMVKQFVPAKVLSFFDNPQILLSPDALAKMQAGAAARGPQALALFNQIIEAVKVGLAQGIHNVFILSLALMIVGLIAVFFLKEIPLRGGRLVKKDAIEAVESEDKDVQAEGSLAAMI